MEIWEALASLKQVFSLRLSHDGLTVSLCKLGYNAFDSPAWNRCTVAFRSQARGYFSQDLGGNLFFMRSVKSRTALAREVVLSKKAGVEIEKLHLPEACLKEGMCVVIL